MASSGLGTIGDERGGFSLTPREGRSLDLGSSCLMAEALLLAMGAL